MTDNSANDPRYPIGQFEPPDPITEEHLGSWIADIESLPQDLRDLVTPLTAEQHEVEYRPGGWTVRQVVHHLADSHLNSFIRFKWALTEERPLIKAYREDLWAELPDSRHTPIEVSINLLEALHARWLVLLRSLSPEQLSREFIHPDSGPVTLAVNVGIYAWHGRHHLAHIQSATRLGA